MSPVDTVDALCVAPFVICEKIGGSTMVKLIGIYLAYDFYGLVC
jgi:hypothetical protein